MSSRLTELAAGHYRQLNAEVYECDTLECANIVFHDIESKVRSGSEDHIKMFAAGKWYVVVTHGTVSPK